MFMFRCLIGLWLWMVCLLPLAAQEMIIEGKVRDANTHREIPGVNIYIRELDIGTVSNAAGRFQLRVIRPEPAMLVTFQHVAYDTLELMIEEVLAAGNVNLQERVISIPVVESESIEDQLEIAQDLPQTVSVLDARIFDLNGYIDAGDLLRTDHSIQVDEALSGRKTVSIRGGNPDEVIVLYNGIKMNSTLDNVFDISLIDLADVERVEVIKGSNTALYGPEGFSGVVNVVPRAQQDYNIRFQQRFGSYDSGNWGLHLFKDIGRLNAGYSIKRGSARRSFIDEPPGRRILENRSEHHTASLSYNFSEYTNGDPRSSLGIMYNRSEIDYENERDRETLANFNQMLSARFTGDLFNLRNLVLSGAYQWLDESQFLRFFDLPSDSGFLDRKIANDSWHFNASKSLALDNFELLLGYQYKYADLDFHDDRIFFTTPATLFESSRLNRQNHGLVSVVKLKMLPQSNFFRRVNFDLSMRYDIVEDEQVDFETPDQSGPGTVSQENSWKESMVKLSTHVAGSNGRFAFSSFINLGSNVKFPTLLQQISTRELLSSDVQLPHLQPERIRSLEVGLNLLHQVDDASLYGWEFAGNVFQNRYQNKFRSYYLPGTPIAVFDNFNEATLTGFEAKQTLYLFRKKATLSFATSRYWFSDQATFPFKHDRKFTFNLRIDQSGYSFQLHAFREGRQIAQIRNLNGGYSEVEIPKFTNLDLHLSKSFEVSRLKLILNGSLRNILDDDFALTGLALHDRRYYLTLGVQY